MLLPESILHSSLFAVLAAFTAVNTVMYGALAIGKLLPKVYVADWMPSRNQRSESRSIYPDPDPNLDLNSGPSGRVSCKDQPIASADDETLEPINPVL